MSAGVWQRRALNIRALARRIRGLIVSLEECASKKLVSRTLARLQMQPQNLRQTSLTVSPSEPLRHTPSRTTSRSGALDDTERIRKSPSSALILHRLGYRPGETAPPKHDITDGRELPYVIAQMANPVPQSIHTDYANSFREVPLQWVESALDRSWLSGLKMYAYHPGGTSDKPTLTVAKRSVFKAFLPWIPMRKKRYCHPTPGDPRSINYECTDFAEEAQAWCVQFGHSACARTLDLFATTHGAGEPAMRTAQTLTHSRKRTSS